MDNGSLNENGVWGITKRFIFELESDDYTTDSKGIRRVSDIAPITVRKTSGFPTRGVALSEDPRYLMSGEATSALTAKEANPDDPNYAPGVDKHYYYIDARYDLASFDNDSVDSNGDPITDQTAPWKLPPDGFTVTYPETKKPFELAYNEKSERKVRVQNRAGSALIADTIDYDAEFSFNYNVKSLSANTGFEYSGTVNKDAITVAGITFNKQSAFMKPLTIQRIRVFENSGAIKWTYDRVSVKIISRKGGWGRRFLNVGTEAIFESGKRAEQIYAYRANQESETLGNVVYTNAAGIAKETKRLEDLDKVFGYEEVTEPLPLTEDGFVDTATIDNPTDGDGNTNYQTLTFREFEEKSWKALNLPKKR